MTNEEIHPKERLMNILSEILLGGYDIKLESSSWSQIINGETITSDNCFFKIEIKKHQGEVETMGAVSVQALQGHEGDEIILNTLKEMWKITEKK